LEWYQITIALSWVEWHKLIWHPRAIPEHIFVVWLVIRNRFSSKVLLLSNAKNEVAFKITIGLLIDHYWILIKW
jgi:hypothetical protein